MVAQKLEEIFLDLDLDVETDSIKEIQQLEIAIRAAKYKSRPPMIAALSGLPLLKARTIYRDVSGLQPNKGQLPSDTAFYVNDINRHLESAWLAQSYRMINHKEDSKLAQCHSLFTAYELYLEKFLNPIISFDRFFLLTRFTFYSKTITLSNCKECHCAKLTVNSYNPRKIIACPVCALHSTAQTKNEKR